MTPRVVITGIGPVTAFGLGIDPLWDAMLAGRTAIRRISRFNPCGFPCKLAAEVPDDAFDIRKIVPKSYRKATKVMCRDIELAVGAAATAVEDAKLVTRATDPDTPPTVQPHRFGCQIGAGLIAADVDELTAAFVTSRGEGDTVDLADWGRTGMQNLTPLWLLKYLPNMLACHVTIVHDCEGPSNTITCCEASGGLSLSESVRVIQRGAADACLTGGAESRLNPVGLLRMHCAGRLAATSDGDDPATVVRPFDAKARGTVLGEGGGILVVESSDHASARGAAAYAEVAGTAATQSLVSRIPELKPDPDGPEIVDAIELALDAAGVDAGDIDAIVPFGSAVPDFDAAEAAAIRRVFGDRAASIPLVTTVPFVGNCCAGHGAVALSVAAKCLREQRLPARLNTKGAAGLAADAAPSSETSLQHVLVFSPSQGGQNTAVVLRRAEER